jgi:hypothetical protein
MTLPLTKKDLETFLDIPTSKEELSNMSCAICIVHDNFHDIFSDVKRCINGTMRCQEHKMQCANCKQEVDSDAQLLCFGCSDSGAGAIYNEILLSKKEEKKCMLGLKNSEFTDAWGCGCPKCMRETAQFYVARAVEEGYASSLSSPRATEDEDHVSFRVANQVLAP